jgi:hypothetical protein
LQFDVAGLAEADPGTGDEVAHRARYQDLARRGVLGYASADVHSDALNVGVDDLALAGVQPDAGREAELCGGVDDPQCASDGASGAVEHGKEPVAEVLDLLTGEAAEMRPHRLVMCSE